MLQSTALTTPKELKIKRVIGNSVWLGETGKGIESRSDLSGYLVADGAFLYANEQDKAKPTEDDREFAEWEHEPVNARRRVNVDEKGQFYNRDNPLPVLVGGQQLVPPEFDDVKAIRDVEEFPTRYEFFLNGSIVGAIDVFYNTAKSWVEYKKGTI